MDIDAVIEQRFEQELMGRGLLLLLRNAAHKGNHAAQDLLHDVLAEYPRPLSSEEIIDAAHGLASLHVEHTIIPEHKKY